MYRYDEFDDAIVRARTRQFRKQVARRLAGEIDEDRFKPLRLMNGVYLQLHAYMLRVAIPYGQLCGRQMRMLAEIADRYDKGYGHFTTRQNIQFNWMALRDVPDVLDLLADVQMHCIQTSGNCIRNVTSDEFAGAAADEITDPRPWCEIIRQWSSLHPEFSFLPRKFKIAVSAATHDRAAIRLHDIGIHMRRCRNASVFDIWVGGGLGRTPHIGILVASEVSEDDLLDHLEAILRVYNRFGRRDNIYKARIKILVQALGEEQFRAEIARELAARGDNERIRLDLAEISRISKCFAPPPFEQLPAECPALQQARADNSEFDRWCATNLHLHKCSGYASVIVSLKSGSGVLAPGDASSGQMRVVAELAEQYSFDDIRVSHAQNLVLPHVRQDQLLLIYTELQKSGLATANANLASDLICCPGLDYCNLANARSIPIAAAIQKVFIADGLEHELGRLHINISGCINACGHHHVGHIGILGVDRRGEEYYQITLGGSADDQASIGSIAGPGLEAVEVAPALKRVALTYMARRASSDESFINLIGRIGTEPFREALYADNC